MFALSGVFFVLFVFKSRTNYGRASFCLPQSIPSVHVCSTYITTQDYVDFYVLKAYRVFILAPIAVLFNIQHVVLRVLPAHNQLICKSNCFLI